MNPIVLAVVSVSAIGLVCAVVLAVAQKVLGVQEDARVTALRGCLPGANCGACGYPGCDGYAKALAQGQAKANLCIPGGGEVAVQLAALLGVEAQAVAAQIARVRCCGVLEKTPRKQEYHGLKTCAGAKLLNGGDKLCAFGCLGYGDCAAACPHDAICLEDGVARVLRTRCVGCAQCVAACPNHLIEMAPAHQKIWVACSNTQKGGATRKVCACGCIGCKKCEKACPADAIHVEDNLAKIDPARCTACGQCVEVCPSRCIFPV